MRPSPKPRRPKPSSLPARAASSPACRWRKPPSAPSTRTSPSTPLSRRRCRRKPGDVIAKVSGKARALLSAERVALNFLGRLSGIATMTRQYVDAIAGTKRQDRRHAQDDAGASRLREICRALRRRLQSPYRPLRRHPDQGQPHRRRRRIVEGDRGGARRQRPHGQARSRGRYARTARRGARVTRSMRSSSTT